jgi:hypothetical protein
MNDNRGFPTLIPNPNSNVPNANPERPSIIMIGCIIRMFSRVNIVWVKTFDLDYLKDLETK